MEIIIYVALAGIVFYINQIFISWIFFVFRLGKEGSKKKREELRYPKTFTLFHWYAYTVICIFGVAIITTIAALMVIKNNFNYVLIYHFLLLLDVVILSLMKKETFEKAEVVAFLPGAGALPSVKFPNRFLNIVFDPVWTLFIFLGVVIYAVIANKF